MSECAALSVRRMEYGWQLGEQIGLVSGGSGWHARVGLDWAGKHAWVTLGDAARQKRHGIPLFSR